MDLLLLGMPKVRRQDNKAIMGLVRLTQEASKRFLAPENNQSAYIDSLLNDIAKKVPVNRSRLSSDNRPQKLFQDQIVIPISIGVANHENERNASKIGFIQNNWNEYKLQITTGIMIFVFSSILFHILSYKLKSEYFEKINFAIYIFGLIIPNFILSILFVINYSNDVPEIYWPSILVLCVPLLINFCIIAVTIYKGIKDPDIGEKFNEWVNEYRALADMSNLNTSLKLRLYVVHSLI
ncbi:hypothetical protein C2G38_1784840 [Gigaspora rosea]|uniref:Uncharacterized protein n=1 Tax=Gigaspora rosea TaxID=44941 RepID=A0A397UTU2_9GLOM|nr:hypothetical protein C2G38_1784840 [Gigaspora rosea]